MTRDYRPSGFRALTPGISAEGSDRLAEFIERAFGGVRRDCTRNAEGAIAHGEIQIGDSIVEIAEARPEWPARPCGIHLYNPDTDALFRRAVDAGARVERAPEDEPYGDRAASLKDPAGNYWFLATRIQNGPVPQGFGTLTPYLISRGADAVIAFMKSAFGATELGRYPTGDGKVMHAGLRIDDSMIEIADDGGACGPMPCGLHLYVPDADATYARAIAAGATSLYEPRDQFYGDREGGAQDPAGNHWYIATHVEDVPEEEIARRLAAMQGA